MTVSHLLLNNLSIVSVPMMQVTMVATLFSDHRQVDEFQSVGGSIKTNSITLKRGGATTIETLDMTPYTRNSPISFYVMKEHRLRGFLSSPHLQFSSIGESVLLFHFILLTYERCQLVTGYSTVKQHHPHKVKTRRNRIESTDTVKVDYSARSFPHTIHYELHHQ